MTNGALLCTCLKAKQHKNNAFANYFQGACVIRRIRKIISVRERRVRRAVDFSLLRAVIEPFLMCA